MTAVCQKPVSMMAEDELNAEAHFIAVRILNGTSTSRDASMVMELSNRLLRHMPRKLPAAATITLGAIETPESEALSFTEIRLRLAPTAQEQRL
jgi:hypothetical protein